MKQTIRSHITQTANDTDDDKDGEVPLIELNELLKGFNVDESRADRMILY